MKHWSSKERKLTISEWKHERCWDAEMLTISDLLKPTFAFFCFVSQEWNLHSSKSTLYDNVTSHCFPYISPSPPLVSPSSTEKHLRQNECSGCCNWIFPGELNYGGRFAPAGLTAGAPFSGSPKEWEGWERLAWSLHERHKAGLATCGKRCEANTSSGWYRLVLHSGKSICSARLVAIRFDRLDNCCCWRKCKEEHGCMSPFSFLAFK